MSTSLLIPQNVRKDFQLLHFPPSSPLPSPRTFHSSISKSNPGSPSSPLHIPLPPTQTPPIYTKTLPGYTHSHAHGHHNQHPHSPHHYHHRSATQFNMTPSPLVHPGAPAHLAHPLLIPNAHHIRPTTPIRLPPLLPAEFLIWLRSAYKRTRAAYTLDLYLADLMSAARHNSRLDGTLLTAKSMKDAMDLAKASRVVGTDLTGVELIRPTGVEDEDQKEEYEYEEDFHSMPSMTAAVRDGPNSTEPKIFEASEVDIARIFPRIVSHRIKLRETPEDEILASALFGATFEPPILPETDEEQGSTFDSVKSLLVSILSEV
ncbi:hypothetical protein CPB83DRAFT_847797 [Crepidotus variabilis]|uniref:Uncharacterized protein n=1 Tax=Crepidotus variabilis TaxID=179855 RepID=A0A9P6JTY4_9AGAR|nr:hypothetical protein CPB83DRAFT_847797 [Crepidotus variabilis]